MDSTHYEIIIKTDKTKMLYYNILGYLTLGTLFFGIGPVYLILMGWFHLPAWIRCYTVSHTEKHIIVRKGVFFKTKKVIPFSKITDFEQKQGPMMRLFGITDISIQTAGRGSDVPEVTIEAVTNPEKVLDTLIRLHEKNNNM